MNARTVIFLSTISFLMMGCVSHSSIDSRKMSSSGKENRINSKNSTSYLTDKDIFGNETTLAVSEEDIQAALRGDKVRVPIGSPVILVQSGNRAPEAIMQQEMSKYYAIATFSGIPDRQKPTFCSNDRNKETNENQDIAVVENTNWMQALRYVAAKGHQKAIIVYQDTLQFGKYDPVTKNIGWSDYKNEQLTGNDSLRYLVRFTLVEVATGEWATWSPVNYEYSVLPLLPGRNGINTVETTKQQIAQLKQNTYAAMVKDLVNRYH